MAAACFATSPGRGPDLPCTTKPDGADQRSHWWRTRKAKEQTSGSQTGSNPRAGQCSSKRRKAALCRSRSSSIDWPRRSLLTMRAHLRVWEMSTWTRASFAEAVDSYQKALKVKPDYNGAYLPLAFSLARLNRYPEAIDVYQETLKRDPTGPEVYNNLSFAYNHTGRYQEAVDASLQAIKLLGETGEAYKLGFQERNEIRSYAYKNLGNAYNGLKRYDEAATALKKSSEIEPKNASAHFNLGLDSLQRGPLLGSNRVV